MSRAAAGGVILAGRFAAITTINYALGLALAWLLTPTQFAQASVLQALLWLGAMLLNSGFPWTVAWTFARVEQGGDEAERVVRSGFLGNAILASALGLVVGLLDATGIVDLSLDPILLLLIGVTLPLFALNAVARGVLHGTTRFGALAGIQVGETMVKTVVILILVWVLGAGVEGVAFGFFAGAVVASVFAWLAVRGRLRWRGPVARAAEFRRALPMFLGTFSFAMMITLDILALRASHVPAIALSVYQAAAMLARAPYFVGDALMDAVFPYMARRHDSPVHSHGWFLAAARWIALIVLPAELALALAPEPILALVFPPEFAPAAARLPLLALGSLGALTTALFGKALQAIGRRSDAAAGASLGVVAEITLLALLVPWAGTAGAATAFAIASWTGAAVAAMLYLKRQGLAFRSAGSLRYATALATMVPLLLASREQATTGAILFLVLAGLAYAVALRVTGLVRADDIRSLLRGSHAVAPAGGDGA